MARTESVGEDAVAQARDAVERRAWRDACDLLASADASGDLSPEDLELLAEAASWIGPSDRAIEARERAYALYAARGDQRSAARVALQLVRDCVFSRSRAVAAGWLRRAERLLEDDPDCIEQGYLAYRHALRAPDRAESRKQAERAAELGRRFGDRDLEALALHHVGSLLVAGGELEEGWSLIDEATAAAIAGELRPTATGVVYCGTICACRDLVDLRRAGEWTESYERWCTRTALPGGWLGDCRVHRAEVLRSRGAWEEAEHEAKLACDEFLAHGLGFGAAEALCEVGEIRLRMGDLPGAEEAFRQAHGHGHDPQPGQALLRLAQGRVPAAVSSIESALAVESLQPLERARLLPARVEISLAAGDLEDAAGAVEELEKIADEFRSPALDAGAACARGAVELERGDLESAATAARRGLRAWTGIEAPYETARARLLLGEVHQARGDEDSAQLELRAAEAAFSRLGAAIDAGRAADLLSGGGTGAKRAVMRTFLFTDVCGSTALVEAIGDDAWHELRAWHDRTLRALFAEHGGHEVDHAGDGFFVAFDQPVPALKCAAAVQRRLAEHRREHGFAPSVRIGVHATDAVQAGVGYTGKGVHEAARIGALADAGEILASRETADAAGAESIEARQVELKGISEPVEIVTVAWR